MNCTLGKFDIIALPVVFTSLLLFISSVPNVLNCDQISIPLFKFPSYYIVLQFAHVKVYSFDGIFVKEGKFHDIMHEMINNDCKMGSIHIYMPKCKVLGFLIIVYCHYFIVKLFHLFFVTKEMSWVMGSSFISSNVL